MGNKHVIVAVDTFSKYTIAAPTKSTGSKEVVEFIINNIIAVHGVPEILFSDNASGLTAKLVKDVAQAFGIKLQNSTPRHHQGNAMVERQIQTLQNKMATSMSDADNTEWDDHVGLACLAINAVKHSTTAYTPYETLFGRKLRLPNEPTETSDPAETYTEALQSKLETIRRNICENIAASNEHSKKHYEARHREMKFEIDDLVMLYCDPKSDLNANKFTPKYKGPYAVTQIKANDIYKLELIGAKKKRFVMAHVSRLKPYRGDNKDVEPEQEMIDLDEQIEPPQLNDEATDYEQQHNNAMPAVRPSLPQRTSRRKQTLSTKNYASFVGIIALMIAMPLASTTLTFIPTESVIWMPSQLDVISGLTH